MSKAMTIAAGALAGAGLGFVGGSVLPCQMYPESNLCGLFGAFTMPVAAVVGGVTGALLSARHASMAVTSGVLLGATLGVVGIVFPARMDPKSDISSLLFLVFPVTTMPAGAAIGGFLGWLLTPRGKPGTARSESDQTVAS